MNNCTAPATAARTTGQPMQVTRLLLTGTGLTALLERAVVSEQWCDAFLVSAGMFQLADDALHPDPLQLHRAASYLRKGSSPSARAAGLGAAALAGTLELRWWGSGARQLRDARSVLADLTSLLATALLKPGSVTCGSSELNALVARAAASAPLLGADVVRLPACFRDFDLHPDDIDALAAKVCQLPGLARGPVCVVGVRTSGSYLAPLLAAALERSGVCEVLTLTHRPAHPFLPWEGRALRRTARAGGSVVVVDDPPATGTALAATLKDIAATRVPHRQTKLALPLFTGEEGLPAQLRGYAGAFLPWAGWSVHGRLDAEAVAEALSDLLGPDWSVERCEARQEVGAAGAARRRDHVRARYTVELTSRETGRAEQRELVVEGAGLGYLGGHALAVADRLRDQVPRVYGLAGGLLYRDWLPEPDPPVGEVGLAAAISAYVASRQQALPTDTDPTPRMRGRDPVWEVTAELLSRPFGWAAPAVRGLLEPTTRSLLTPGRPSVVDGATTPWHWFRDPEEPQRLRKVDFHQGVMGRWGPACYDAVFDLAGAACEPLSPGFAHLLREQYEAWTGDRPDDERWLLYRLAQLWRLARSSDLEPHALGRYSAAAVHDFLAACYLGGLADPTGPLCAVDLDGVLETDRLGYPCATPLGMMALRALTAHGYRVVLATGRGIDDARDRCTAFRLPGAVVEYGTAVYLHDEGLTVDLRDADERALLDDVRRQLASHGVLLLPTHSYTIRARLHGGPVPPDLVADIPLLSDPALRLVHGQSQTDVTVARLDKATGLTCLAHSLHGCGGLALAVGDTGADVTMLRSATMARAPRNADAVVQASGIPLTRGAYQSGLSDACTALLGHRPGRCPVCRMPDLPPRTRQLLTLLALSEPGVARLPLRIARAAGVAMRARHEARSGPD